MATSVPERSYTPGDYGPFSLSSGPLKTRAKVTFTRTSGGVNVWPEGPCIRFVIEERVSGNTWRTIETWTASGGGSPFERDGVTPATTSLAFPKAAGVDVRVSATVLQTITTAITLDDAQFAAGFASLVAVGNVDGTHVATNVTGGTFAFTTAGSNAYLVVGVCGFDSGASTWSPTEAPSPGYVRYNSVDLTQIKQQQDGIGDNSEIWGIAPGSLGSLNVDVLIGHAINVDELAITAECLTGVNTAAPTAGAAGASGTASPCTVTAGATPAAGDLIVDVAYAFGTPSFSVGADQTSRVNQNITGSSSVLSSTQPDGVGSVMSWTGTMSNWSTAAVIIKATAADPSMGKPYFHKTHRPAAYKPGLSR